MPSSGAPTDRKFADSLLEEAGFEPSVPRLRWSSVQLVTRDATDAAIAKPDRRSHPRGDEPGLEAWASSFHSIHNKGAHHAEVNDDRTWRDPRTSPSGHANGRSAVAFRITGASDRLR